jgi:penicillin-binding protein 1A
MTGAKAALPIWVDFMKEFVRLHGEEDFGVPAGITSVQVCSVTGMLAKSGCRAVTIAYRSGTEPHEYCTVHGGTEPPPPQEEPETDEGW